MDSRVGVVMQPDKTVERTYSSGDMGLARMFSIGDSMMLWGGSTTDASDPALTVKHETGVSPPTSFSPSTVELSAVLTRSTNGSMTMVLPGSSVTLQSRNMGNAAGEYEIGGVVGRGGMGVVYFARQASLDRRVVLKKIAPEQAGNVGTQEKFITEALATGALEHPNVVPIHELGMDGNGELYYAMKEVKGREWRQVMPELTEMENIDILHRVTDAVAFAHDKGILHRDIKPENVMIGSYGEVLLMDWGLAVAISPAAKASPLTAGNACAGTPSFMAPEMARGAAGEIGPWSDQYLLGATLYAILTGKPPHPGTTVLEAVTNAANNVIQPSDRDDEWMRIAMRAMSPVYSRRYPSVKAFQRALKDCREHAESINMVRAGEEILAEAIAGEGYEKFTRALFSFEEALSLWSGNKPARNGLVKARLRYAERAYRKGDYDLAASIVVHADGKMARRIYAAAKRGVATREFRAKWIRTLGLVAVSALVLTAVVAGGASILISRQAAAEKAARLEADRQRANAEEQRLVAENALEEVQVARKAENAAQQSRLREQELKLQAEETARREAENARQKAEEALRAREAMQRIGWLEDNSRWSFSPEEGKRRQERAAAETGLPVEMDIAIPGADQSLAFRLIPSGEFVMGSPPRDPTRYSDEHLHEVRLTHPYYMGAREITRGEWQAVVGVEDKAYFGQVLGEAELRALLWRCAPVTAAERDLPAVGVSFRDVEKLFLPGIRDLAPPGMTFRLPTEAEWEWAARSGAAGQYYGGDRERDLAAGAWYERNSGGRLHPVGGKTPNAWGLYDTLGNAAEVLLDAFDSSYYLKSPQDNPLNDGKGDFRVARGGSFTNSPRQSRLAGRSYVHVDNRHPQAGFRLVLQPAAKPAEENGGASR